MRCSLTAAIRAWVNYCNWSTKQSLVNTCFQCGDLSPESATPSPSLFSPPPTALPVLVRKCQVVDGPTGDGWMRERDVRSILISFDFITLLLHPITYTQKILSLTSNPHIPYPQSNHHFASVRIQYHRLYPQFLFRERPRVFISRRTSTIKFTISSASCTFNRPELGKRY